MSRCDKRARYERLVWRPAASDASVWRPLLLTLAVVVFSAACSRVSTNAEARRVPSPTTAASEAAPPNLADEAIASGEWPMAAHDYRAWRYSPLDEINASNVNRLRVAWTFSSGVLAGHEAAPIVVGSTMYVVTPFPDDVYALDLSKPGAPMRWHYASKVQSAAKGVACCDTVNRGVVYWNGLILFATLDDRAIALDAATGALRWQTALGDINRGETITMAPIVAEGKLLVGNSGGEFGVRGWLTALDAETGRIAWRAYSTGPDRDVLIGPSFQPPYPQDRGTDLGVSSWPPDAWRIGGGGVWGWLSYDPDRHLVYAGTGNPGPWNANQRPGDNKWTSGIFARDVATGEARWFYQWDPHDQFDYDGVNENILIDLPIQGAIRQVLVHPDRDGYVYVLDRGTGRVLSATPFVRVTTSRGVDPTTGRLLVAPDKAPRVGVVVRDICPASPGAKDWQPSSYSPRTHLVYIPHNNLCMDSESREVSYIAGTPYVGAHVVFHAGPGGNEGALTAWDPVARQAVWSIPERYPVWSGTVTTAADLVFYGTLEGWFKAVDARTGRVVWQFKTGSGVIGQPVSYRGPDGHQYIAVFSGVGGWPGAIVSANLDTRDPSAANGWGEALAPLKQATTAGGTLYVFTVEGQ